MKPVSFTTITTLLLFGWLLPATHAVPMTTIFRLLQEVDNNTTVNDAETPPAASPGMDGVAVATGTESASGTSAAMALAATMCPEVSEQMASCMNTTCTEAETACSKCYIIGGGG